MTTQTRPILDKVAAGGSIDSDELRLLQTLTEMQNAPEIEPDDRIIDKGGDKAGPMVRTKSTSAGYIHLRRNSDGKLVLVSRNQLVERLKQKLADGRPAWLSPTAQWTGRVRVPSFLCPLNEKHPDRPRMDLLNLEMCEKRGKLMSASALRRHLMKKHKDSFEAIEREIVRQREDNRDKRDALTSEALLAVLAGRTAPVAAAAAGAPKAPSEPVTMECQTCHVTVEALGRLGAVNKLRAHERKEHPKAA